MRKTMSSHSVRWRTNVLVLLIITLSSFGNTFLRVGMSQARSPSHWTMHALLSFFGRAFDSADVWFGIILLALFAISQMLVLSFADYSYILPASATSYVIVALLGHFMLGEQVPLKRWAGIALICAGAVVVGRTHPVTGGQH